APLGTPRGLSPIQLRPNLGNPLRRKTTGSLELIHVGSRQREASRPFDPRLSLGVQIAEPDRPGGLDLVLGDILARNELEDVETASDLGAHDGAVVPVHGPAPSHIHPLRIDGPSIVECYLNGIARVRPVVDGDPALVPGLHHDIPAWNWNQGPIMRHTVFLLRLRSGHLVVAL